MNGLKAVFTLFPFIQRYRLHRRMRGVVTKSSIWFFYISILFSDKPETGYINRIYWCPKDRGTNQQLAKIESPKNNPHRSICTMNQWSSQDHLGYLRSFQVTKGHHGSSWGHVSNHLTKIVMHLGPEDVRFCIQ